MPELFSVLQRWHEAGWLRQLDRAMSRFLWQQGVRDEFVLLSAALLSYQVGRGHVCMNIRALTGDPFRTLGIERNDAPELHHILKSYSEKPLGKLLSSPAVNDGVGATPLVLSSGNLYLRRYWQFERFIGDDLECRMQVDRTPDKALLKRRLDDLFPRNETDTVNWQKLACANSVRSNFSVITGGPGTGKTYTVVRLLAILHTLSEGTPRIFLAAPTGKAAARLKSSIVNALSELSQNPELQHWRGVFKEISTESYTVHRLLGRQPGSRAFRHHKNNPLRADGVIIDEASMVDIELMASILNALPSTARLILLGDKDQLASVEAGAVLGQLCSGAERACYTPETFTYLQSMSGEPRLPQEFLNPQAPLRLQQITMLRVSRRFDDASGIGQLATAVNRRESDKVRAILAAAGDRWPDIQYIRPSSVYENAFKTLCVKGFSSYLNTVRKRPDGSATDIDTWARTVLKRYADFQLLTPLRSGDWGLAQLNEAVTGWLHPDSTNEHWYDGRPVMVNSNDYSLNLRNGDVGIVLPWKDDGSKRVVFIDGDDELRWIQPSRLTDVTTAYAMTVHKSQGSEFTHTVVVLPQKDSPVLSKELLYTAITRARQKLTLVVPEPGLITLLTERQVSRVGGLSL